MHEILMAGLGTWGSGDHYMGGPGLEEERKLQEVKLSLLRRPP